MREKVFLKREMLGGAEESDIMKYQRTIGIDNLFPLERI